jgi:hypothetical protein
MAQVVECLLCKCEALSSMSSNPNPTKKNPLSAFFFLVLRIKPRASPNARQVLYTELYHSPLIT